MPFGMDLIRGTLDLLVMEGLRDGRALHGFALQEWLRERSGGAFEVEEGALYPALYRMAQRGWLASEWGVSDRGRRAKYYRLTPAGEAALVSERKRWHGYVEVMDRMVRQPEGG